MKKLGKVYSVSIYPGTGHGFMRTGEEPNPKAANKNARDEAWQQWKDLLKKI